MSYLEHYNLTEQPFRLTPDPDFVYWSKQHARAKAYLESTIWLADGFVIITGEIGSGKTTLLQSFLGDLDDTIVYAMVSQTQLSPTQFLRAVLTEFGFSPFKKKKAELLDMINSFLIEQYGAGKKVFIIIDEAQNLTTKVLEEIRLLSGIETHKEKILRIILAGQPELKDKIESSSLEQLAQRVRLKFHLGPLSKSELHDYIDHRMRVAGSSGRKIFDKSAEAAIFRATRGIPRLINTVCDTALLCGFAGDEKKIDETLIKTALDELGWEHVRRSGSESRHLKVLSQKPKSVGALGRIEIRERDKVVGNVEIGEGRFVIGRTDDNDIYLNSQFVSRHHAQIVANEEFALLEDLNSTNGIFVGSRKIKKWHLRDGDVVVIGKHELRYTDLRDSNASSGVNDELSEKRRAPD